MHEESFGEGSQIREVGTLEAAGARPFVLITSIAISAYFSGIPFAMNSFFREEAKAAGSTATPSWFYIVVFSVMQQGSQQARCAAGTNTKQATMNTHSSEAMHVSPSVHVKIMAVKSRTNTKKYILFEGVGRRRVRIMN